MKSFITSSYIPTKGASISTRNFLDQCNHRINLSLYNICFCLPVYLPLTSYYQRGVEIFKITY